MQENIFVSDYARLVSQELKLPKRVRIFDTTLRDGDQTPGVSFTPEQKLLVARQLDRLGVDVIEAGTPVSSEGERRAVSLIAKAGLKAEICALARPIKEDVDTAIACGIDCAHIFISTSDLHLKHVLKMSREQVLKQAVKFVEYAKDQGVKVEFSAMDATRTELNYLIEVYKAVVDAGADRINVPDTIGAITPRGMYYLISQLKPHIKVPISVHCHDDLGLAVANSLAAVEAGAEQVQVAVNGLGERAGNASLEEVVMALKTLYGIKLRIKTRLLTETSDLVERLTGMAVPPNKAIVGDNAFAHVSGIHAHGVIEFPGTYEPFSPELVGHHRRLALGKLTGRHSVEKQLRSIGVKANKRQLAEITRQVKALGDKGKQVTEVDLRAIAENVIGALPKEEKVVELKEVTVTTGSTITPTASVRLSIRGQERVSSATGVGPVDAAIAAIRAAMGEISKLKLKKYHLDAITGGSDALAEVTVELEDEHGNVYLAKGIREDVVLASVDAMINGINRYFAGRK
ncbi:MAG: 2-isopropylmalate synthase [Candidatus Hadarchaeum yellowstonense]|uniref:2-isopropylmalate synthase n=1 Tax=Hadarchaeum yellowstonense TaxID=1776334 RepID=A0A147K1B1_HADYE|nr:MAG: 2-isopropylmalate synthase [Candidatus Hadarchaeum yellowstonense]